MTVLKSVLLILACSAAEFLPVINQHQSRQRQIDVSHFATADELYIINTHVGGAGLRGTASPAQAALIDYLEGQFKSLGLQTSSDSFNLTAWTPEADGLHTAGRLTLASGGSTAAAEKVAVAGAVPYSKPVSNEGTLVYLPGNASITTNSAANRMILRDVQYSGMQFSTVFDNLTSYRTNDTSDLIGTRYDRPYLANSQLSADLTAASKAGAAGVVFLWPMQSRCIEGYFDPHSGTQYTVPAVYAGSEVAKQLKDAAANGVTARISVRADVKRTTTRQLFATLTGSTSERVYVTSHSDGNTWLQDSGVSAVLALAKYFAQQVPQRERRRTLVFAITSGHLHGSTDGAARLAAQLDAEYDKGDVAAVVALEHLGAREILPSAADPTDLAFTGKAELATFAAGPSHALRDLLTRTVISRGMNRTAVTRGETLANRTAVPHHSALGGIGTFYHDALVPTVALLTGPWALWMPVFGAQAVDFGRLRMQAVAVGDVLLGLDGLEREQIEGEYAAYRSMRARGVPRSGAPLPPEQL